MKNALTTLPKSVFILLGVTTTALAADRGYKKKIRKRSGTSRSETTILIKSNQEMKHITKVVK